MKKSLFQLFFVAAAAVCGQIWLHGCMAARLKLILRSSFTPTAAAAPAAAPAAIYKLGYAALIGYIWVVRAAAAAAVGIEEE